MNFDPECQPSNYEPEFKEIDPGMIPTGQGPRDFVAKEKSLPKEEEKTKTGLIIDYVKGFNRPVTVRELWHEHGDAIGGHCSSCNGLMGKAALKNDLTRKRDPVSQQWMYLPAGIDWPELPDPEMDEKKLETVEVVTRTADSVTYRIHKDPESKCQSDEQAKSDPLLTCIQTMAPPRMNNAIAALHARRLRALADKGIHHADVDMWLYELADLLESPA